MEWNLSYENFKVYGPDHPSEDIFRTHFSPDGAWIVWLPLERLGEIIDERRMSVSLDVIKNDVIGDSQWTDLKKFLASNSPVAPPWALMMRDTKKLGPVHGLHRFQYAISISMEIIPVVVNYVDAKFSNLHFGCRIEKMEP